MHSLLTPLLVAGLAMGSLGKKRLLWFFICGLINILITVTKGAQTNHHCYTKSLQNAISGGIGLFIAYIGFWSMFNVD